MTKNPKQQLEACQNKHCKQEKEAAVKATDKLTKYAQKHLKNVFNKKITPQQYEKDLISYLKRMNTTTSLMNCNIGKCKKELDDVVVYVSKLANVKPPVLRNANEYLDFMMGLPAQMRKDMQK
jgi:3-oxoacyl-[acyl-carrier-protein] synthase III